MSYDGFYSNLSSRGNVNSILNKAEQLDKEIKEIQTNLNAIEEIVGFNAQVSGVAAQVSTSASQDSKRYSEEALAAKEQAQLLVLSSGFELPAIPYVDGAPLVIARPTQLVVRGGQLYSVRADKVFPYTLTGAWETDLPNLVPREDQSLRQQLADKIAARPLLAYEWLPPSESVATVAGKLSSLKRGIWEFAKYAEGYVAGGSTALWNWWPAIDRASKEISASGGGSLDFPDIPDPEGYRINGPIFMRSGVTYEGDGLINNYRATSTVFGDQMVFLPGAFANDFYNALTYNVTAPIVAGSQEVTLANPVDASRYVVGDTVILRDTPSIVPGSVAASAYMRFNIVTAIAGAVLTLKHPHDRSESLISISRTDNEVDFYPLPDIPRQKCYVAVNSHIKGLRIKTNGFWTGATAALSCTFKDFYVEKARALVYGNSYQRCVFSKPKGNFQRILLEIASNSFMTTVEGIEADRVPGDTNETNIVIINEGSEDVHVSGILCNMNSARSFAQLVSLAQSKNCSVRKGTFYCAGWRGTLVAANIVAGLCKDAVVEDLTFYAGSETAYGVDLLGDGFVDGVAVRRIKIYGPTLTGGAGRLGASNCELSDISVESSAPFLLLPSAKVNRVNRNSIPGGFSATSGMVQAIIAANFFSGNLTTRYRNILGAAFSLSAPLAVSSTVPNTVAISRPLNAPSFGNASVSRLKVRVRGNVTGVTGVKSVRLSFAGVVVATLDFTAAETGRFSMEVDWKPLQEGGPAYCVTDKLGVQGSVRTPMTGLNLTTTNYSLDLAAWVDAAGSGVTIDDFEVIPSTII